MTLGPQFYRAGQPEQLRMFMTPKEIMKEYEPLGGDRHEIHMDIPDDPGAYRVETNEELWNRKSEEAHLSPKDYIEVRGAQAGDRGTFTSFMSKVHGDEITGGPGPEPELQTGHTSSYLARKESWDDHLADFIENDLDFYSHNRNQGSIADSIRESGVQNPVRLGPTRVTGGHHRIAAANTINPDMLIPVLHEQEDRPNHRDRVYPYT